ncbi:MAG: DUF302 domain-containing protein [Ignavibacteriales bacterium]|nr:DUF302 domain-containing protein [Ignavibacteriales bacterium]
MDSQSPFLTFESDLDVDELISRMSVAAEKRGFHITHTHDMKATFEKHGMEQTPYKIVELCNPHMAHKALQADKKMGAMMPKQICVYENAGKTTALFMKPNPDNLDRLFPGMGVSSISKEVVGAMRGIIEEASAA